MNALEVFEVKVSKKRLISIPKDVAERLGIEEGDEAEALRRGRRDRDRAY